MFNVSEFYSRSDLHLRYGGQPHTRICTPAAYNMIMLFSADTYDSAVLQENAYLSGWTSYGVYRFVGEGRYGHMTFTRGNAALRNHARTGKSLYLFSRLDDTSPDLVRYEGEFVYWGHFYKEGLDLRNTVRRLIVFILKPV